MKEVRILQVLGRSAGGIARHVSQLTAAIDGIEGFKVDIAGPVDLPILMPKAVTELDIPSGPLSGHHDAVRRIRTLLEEGAYDVVHAHGLRAGIDSGHAARALNIPVLLTVHNLVRPEIAGNIRSAAYRWAEPLAVWNSERTFAVSEDIANHLRRVARTEKDKIEVLYLGIGPAPEVTEERAAVRRRLGLTDTQPLVVTVARLAPQKAVHVLLDAVALLPEHVVLAIVGEGPLEDALKAQASKLGIADRVRWIGFTDRIADHLVAADVFCLSSVWEGVPLAAQEAILLGTPVVATAVGGLPELIEDRVSGRLVAKADPGALAEALQHVLASSEGARRYAKVAREGLLERFSTERMLERLTHAYLEAAGD